MLLSLRFAALIAVTTVYVYTMSSHQVAYSAPAGVAQGGRGGDGGQPLALKELCDRAPLIVDAKVQSLFPSYEQNPRTGIYTDVLLRVDKVLKGKEPNSQIVLTNPGGTVGTRTLLSNHVFKPGERYILFLRPLSASDLGFLPQSKHGEITPYWLFTQTGNILVGDGDRVHIHGGGALPAVEGLKVNDLLAEIGKLLAVPK
jgi:hypothetical protein